MSGGGFATAIRCVGADATDCIAAVDGSASTSYMAAQRQVDVTLASSSRVIAVSKFHPVGGDGIVSFALDAKPDGASDWQLVSEWTAAQAPSGGQYVIYDGFETAPTREVRIRVTNPATGAVNLTDFQFYVRDVESGTTPPPADDSSTSGSSSSLSAGAIVGIVIAILIVLVLIVIVVSRRSSSSGTYEPNRKAAAVEEETDGGAAPKFENPVFEADDEDY